MAFPLPLAPSLLVCIAILAGPSLLLNALSATDVTAGIGGGPLIVPVLVAALAAFILLRNLQRVLRLNLLRLDLPPRIVAVYSTFDTLTYGVFGLFAGGAFGIRFDLILVGGTLLSFVGLQAILILSLLVHHLKSDIVASKGFLLLLFALSGAATLVYLLVWQRLLFTVFGVSTETISVVVSVLVFGLGLGSLAGVRSSAQFPQRPALIFLACQIVIGLCGLLSRPLISALADITLHNPPTVLVIACFGLLSVPILLTGAALSHLAASWLLTRHRPSTDSDSLVSFYCANILGAATASFLGAGVLFAFFDLHTALLLATLLHLIVGGLAVAHDRATTGSA
jgi:hypothetical protein